MNVYKSICGGRRPGRAAILAVLLLLSSGRASAGTGRLIVKVRDAGTGRNIPARLAIRASDGRYPGDRIGLHGGDRSGIEAHGVFIDGEGSFELPAGRTSIVAAHGAGYDTDSAELDVSAGGTITAELRLRRFLDMRELGWVGGDAHIHMIHGEDQRPTGYADVATACRAGGLDWAYVAEEYTGAGTLDLAGYEAECRNVSTDDFRLFIGGERPKSLLGHHALIGVADPFVIPDDPPYYRAARAIHDQGGVFFNVHPVATIPRRRRGIVGSTSRGTTWRELVFDAFLGPSFDGISVLSDDPAYEVAHRLWFNLLNRGFFVPPWPTATRASTGRCWTARRRVLDDVPAHRPGRAGGSRVAGEGRARGPHHGHQRPAPAVPHRRPDQRLDPAPGRPAPYR